MPTKAQLEQQLKAAQEAANKVAATPTTVSSSQDFVSTNVEATVIARAVNRSGNLILTLEFFQGEEAATAQVSLTSEQLQMFQILGTPVPKSGASVKAKTTRNVEWLELLID